MLGYNKVCELEDFRKPELVRYARAIFARDGRFAAGYVHRKYWEIAQAARSLDEFGVVHAEAELLGVAAGVEATSFWLTNHARRVFATDLYLDPGDWQVAAPSSMLTSPGERAPCDWNPKRLVVQHMDARELLYEDATFDGVFSASSIEHLGNDLDQALAEIYRVLKPGGIVSLSTEFRLEGPSPGLPGTLIFDAAELTERVVAPFAWKPVEPLDVTVSGATITTETPLAEAFADAEAGRRPRSPHIVLREGEFLFTSVHLALRKL
jgi:ubiquinone/menaquinone biosynthesis C-methylase UbiE